MKLTPKIVFSVVSLVVVAIGYIYQQNSEPVDNDDKLLVHNVYFYLNEDVSEKEVEQFEEGLEVLLTIAEIYRAEIGVPAKTGERDVMDHSFVYSIFTEFKKIEDYEVYAVHPDHMKFIEKYDHLWSDVKVYDSEIIFERQ